MHMEKVKHYIFTWGQARVVLCTYNSAGYGLINHADLERLS